MINVPEVLELCKKNWSINYDEELPNHFCETFVEWLNSFSQTEQQLLIKLINDFKYYSQSQVNKILKYLHEELLQKPYKLNPDETIYSIISSTEGNKKSAHEYWINYTNINGIPSNNSIVSLSEFKHLDKVKNIVFIDDINGTGRTFVKFIEANKSLLQEKKIYYIVIHCMNSASTCVNKFANTTKIDIQIISHCSVDKFFSDGALELAALQKLSEQKTIKKDYILGYRNSQSLVAFYNNTPNNTFGIFWNVVTNKYQPPFPRKDKGTTWEAMSEKKKSRNVQNYNRKVGC